MRSLRVWLCLLLIALAACAAGKSDKADKCPVQSDAQCAKKAAAPRRAVTRNAERPVAPVAPSTSSAPVILPPYSATAPAPTIGTCDPGGCWDTGGNRYNGGTNNTFLNGSGRLCQRNGVSMQCF